MSVFVFDTGEKGGTRQGHLCCNFKSGVRTIVVRRWASITPYRIDVSGYSYILRYAR